MPRSNRRGRTEEKLQVGPLLKAFQSGRYDEDDLAEGRALVKGLRNKTIRHQDLDMDGVDPDILKAMGYDPDAEDDDDDDKGGDADEDLEEEESGGKLGKSAGGDGCDHADATPGAKFCGGCGANISTAKISKSLLKELEELADDESLVVPGKLEKSFTATDEGKEAYDAFSILQDLVDRDSVMAKALQSIDGRLAKVDALEKEVKALRKSVAEATEDPQTKLLKSAGQGAFNEITAALTGYQQLRRDMEEIQGDLNERPQSGNPRRSRIGKSGGGGRATRFAAGDIQTKEEALDLIRKAAANGSIRKSIAAEASGRCDYVGKAPGLTSFDQIFEEFQIPTTDED